MKTCVKCGHERQLSEFHRDPQNRDGLRGQCKPCYRLWWAGYREKNRDLIRERGQRSQWKNRHGLDGRPADGPCAICGTTGPRVVDHDHSCCAPPRSCTKCQRGLLCFNCNSAIGLFEDNTGVLESAIRYLMSPPGVR